MTYIIQRYQFGIKFYIDQESSQLYSFYPALTSIKDRALKFKSTKSAMIFLNKNIDAISKKKYKIIRS